MTTLPGAPRAHRAGGGACPGIGEVHYDLRRNQPLVTTQKKDDPDERPEPPPVDLDDIAGWVEADRQLTGQINAAEQQIEQLRAELKVDEITQARDTIRAQIQAAMGEAWEARIGGRPVIRWKPHKPTTTFDSARFRKEHGDLWTQYQKPKQAPRPFVLLDPADGA